MSCATESRGGKKFGGNTGVDAEAHDYKRDAEPYRPRKPRP